MVGITRSKRVGEKGASPKALGGSKCSAPFLFCSLVGFVVAAVVPLVLVAGFVTAITSCWLFAYYLQYTGKKIASHGFCGQ